MGSWKLEIVAAIGAALVVYAVYGGLTREYALLLAGIGGAMSGYMYGTIRAIERLYKHVKGCSPDSRTTDEILDRLR